MPPVPHTCTFRSSGKDFTARAMASPSRKQRLAVGVGYWMTFTASGITFTGHSAGWSEHQRQRHGESVIDVHLVHQREIELLEHHAVRDVPGELRVPLHDGNAARSPAFVGRRERIGAAEREGGHDIERERRGVIVVDEDDDVGLLFARATVASTHSPRRSAPSQDGLWRRDRARRRSQAHGSSRCLR